MKLAASIGRWRVPNARKGRRPMSVTTLLRKEQDGSLFKVSTAHGRLTPMKDDVPDMHGDSTTAPVEHRMDLQSTLSSRSPALHVGTVKEAQYSVYASSRAFGFFTELEKLATPAPVTRSEAEHTLHKLRALEKNAPTPNELGRGAAVGAAAGPVAAAVSKTIAGGWKKGFSSNIRDVAGQAASGAIFGGGVPFARHNLEHNSAEKRLRGYLDQSRGGKLKTTIQKELGKQAGIFDAIKRVALTEIPNTKPWLIDNASKATRHAKTTGKAVIPKVGPPPSSRRTSSGAYDVSALAARMGV